MLNLKQVRHTVVQGAVQKRNVATSITLECFEYKIDTYSQPSTVEHKKYY